MGTFSLLTCTRDPNPALLEQLVRAVEALRVPSGWTREWIVVDHHSTTPVSRGDVMVAAKARCAWLRILEDASPRISGARARSIEESSGEILIVLDDDCAPAPDYLEAALALRQAHPEVHCWGPGRVTLGWIGGSPPPWLDASWRTAFFQERNRTDTQWAQERGWPPCYASGVGMVMTQAPAREYARRVRSGAYRAVERSKASVIRGEDAQLLWTAVQLGGAAGSSPMLALRHEITVSRLELGYLCRLAFGLRESALPCQAEVFGTSDAERPDRFREVRSAVRSLLTAVARIPWRGAAAFRLAAADALGGLVGVWRVHERPEPFWLRAMIAILRVR